MIQENLIEMISSYFKLDEEKFKNVVNNIDGMNINSVDILKPQLRPVTNFVCQS